MLSSHSVRSDSRSVSAQIALPHRFATKPRSPTPHPSSTTFVPINKFRKRCDRNTNPASRRDASQSNVPVKLPSAKNASVLLSPLGLEPRTVVFPGTWLTCEGLVAPAVPFVFRSSSSSLSLSLAQCKGAKGRTSTARVPSAKRSRALDPSPRPRSRWDNSWITRRHSWSRRRVTRAVASCGDHASRGDVGGHVRGCAVGDIWFGRVGGRAW
mmetsp:Transcript_2086/g.8075  ORF Transcript_2086/g.8075 Transcript_2086/m.8075 type:complete len:212 (-) Transcript_2086:1927-2562(-)